MRLPPRLRLCLLIWFLPMCLPAVADPMKEYQNAAGNYERGEFYTAILSLRRSIADNPNFIPAHLLMGDVLVKLGKFTEADSSYVWAERNDPQNMDAATRRLRLYAIYLKDFDKAQKLLDDVSSRFGQNPEIHFYKAQVMVGKHNYMNARRELKLALALREKYFDARKLQLEIESIIGDPKKIIEAAGLLLDDFPDVVESYEASVGHLLKAKAPVERVIDLFSKAPPALLLDPRFGRLMARLNLLADSEPYYVAAEDILRNLPLAAESAEAREDLAYLRSLSDVARGRPVAGIETLADFLRDVPDRPYLMMQLDLWLLRHAPVSDPLRLKRAEERLKVGRQAYLDAMNLEAFIPLYLARKLNPRDKEIRRYLAETAWRMGLAESARAEIMVARNLDPDDETIFKRYQSFSVEVPPTDDSRRRTYNLFVFRLSDDPASVRPALGRLVTDAIALFAEALTPFRIQALEPAVPFEKAEEVAHQKGADFFFHGRIGLNLEGAFSAELGIFPVGGSGDAQALEFKEQHVVLKSRSDFTDDLILETVKSLQLASAQYARVVKKEREGAMIVDVGRRHGLNASGQFGRHVLGRPLLADVINIYEWFARIRVQEVERARFIGIGDFVRQVDR